jgi:hypothetical protein
MEIVSSDQKKCPLCGETILAVAVKCKYCGEWFDPGAKRAQSLQGAAGWPSGLAEARSFRRYPQLFDRKLFGINYHIGAACFVVSFLGLFLYPLIYGFSHPFHFYFSPLGYYLIQIFFLILMAALFVLISHLALEDWVLPLLYGLICVLVHIFRLLILQAIPMDKIKFMPPFHIGGLIAGFLSGFMVFLGLVLAVRSFGPKIWSFILWSAGAYVLLQLLYPLCYMSMNNKYRLNSISLISDLIEGVLWGALIYAGIVLHLRKKSIHLGA